MNMDAYAARRRREASWWFARLRERELSNRLLPRWQKWLSDPANRNVFDEITRMNALLRRLEPQVMTLRETPAATKHYDGRQSVEQWRADQALSQTLKKKRLQWGLTALGLMTAASIAFYAINVVPSKPMEGNIGVSMARMSVMETGVGEHKEFVLADQSRISVGAKTIMTAEITDHSRTVMLERGEALFHVARDPQRPFRVVAGQGTITAIGTAFNVRRRQDDQVVVTVAEGKVEVATQNKHPVSSDKNKSGDVVERQLVKGQELTYDLHGKVSDIRLTQDDPTTDWRDGRLHYRGERLRDVVQDVNRYSHRPLIIGDKETGDLLYSGTVFERAVDDWIAGLPRIYPEIEVVESDAQHLVVRTRPMITSAPQ